MNKTIQDGDLIVQLNVAQMRAMLEEVVRQSSSAKTDEPEILDIEEASRLTGYTKATIYSMINRRQIPCAKPEHGGRRVYFVRSEIIKWLSAVEVKTNEQAFQDFKLDNGRGRRAGGKSTRREYLPGFADKQEYREFLHRNLREAKNLLKLLKFIHSLLLANKNYGQNNNYSYER